ncbi:DNRLRE domain-containing protein [Robertmurraya kyonggiensis]|uniref:DNRLRE domain-containing protein n=1 Tax=Robertmurraya kyonggiensis TaxID=1037680 RepID=UPI00130E6AED|nr:DNRLRE domain-containing protein [Robertmurraya kyonggiensis]
MNHQVLIYGFSSTNNSSPVNISLFKVSRDWNENEASWNYAKIYPSTAWTYKGGDYVTSNKLATVSGLTSPTNLDADIKQWNIPIHIIQNWRNDMSTNFGVIIMSDTETTNIYKKFISSEYTVDNKYKPLLKVTYSVPGPSTPSGESYSNGDGTGTGFVELSWPPMSGATGYKVWIFNGLEYESFDVGNSTNWSTLEKIFGQLNKKFLRVDLFCIKIN